MIKRFSVVIDYKNNTSTTQKEQGNPEDNFEKDIAEKMQQIGITDNDIISVTTSNSIVYDFFYKFSK